MNLPFSRFRSLQTLAIEARRDEVKEKFTIAAFIGWQMGASIKVPGEPEGATNTFQDHLVKLGLADKVTKEPMPVKPEDAPPLLESQRVKWVTPKNKQGADYDMLRAMGGKGGFVKG